MVSAVNFFKNGISDNSYDIRVNEKIFPSLEDDIFHDKKRYKANFRESGITHFLQSLNKEFGIRNISEKEISIFQFDEEFEANLDQPLINIKGYDFNDITISTSNIVGSIVHKSISFNINCRFGNSFLRYMIANTSGFIELEDLGNISSEIGLGEWILLYYWKLELKRAFSLGLYKTYEKNNAELNSIRGAININAYINKPYFDGKINCDYREHSFDNQVNSILSMAIRKVFKSKYQSLVYDIFEIRNTFLSLNLKPVNLNSVATSKIVNPYFYSYKKVVDLSLKILKNEFANVGNHNANFSAFLFDISLLFEHHIRKILKENLRPYNIHLFKKNKVEFNIPNGIYKNNIYPDVIIDYGNNKVGIYDVKYKRFDTKDGVKREDRFQLISYVATHLNKYDVVECGFIYPVENKDCSQDLYEQTLEINSKSIPFKVILYRVFDEPKKQMEFDRNCFKTLKVII